MDTMGKKYEYVMEPSEIREFCLAVLWEQFKCRKSVWIRLLLIMAAEFIFLPEAAVMIVVMVAVMFLVSGIYNYTTMSKLLEGQPWCIWTEDGKLKVERGDYSEVACQNIEFIRMTRHLLMLGYLQTAKRPAWFVMPLHIFGNVQEREMFLELIRNPQAGAGAAYMGTEPVGTEPTEYMRFSYGLDEERWVRFQKGAAGILNGGSLGKPMRTYGMMIWGLVIAAVLTGCVYFVAGTLNWMLVCFCLAVTVWMILRIYCRNPEKSIRKQLKSPEVYARACGSWQVSLMENGISVRMPGDMMSFYSWESLDYLLETEETFYIFHKDKRHYIMIAKECFVSWEQADLFHRICMDKEIQRIVVKKAHYVPEWLSWLMIGLILAVSFLMLLWKIFLDSGIYGRIGMGSGSGKLVVAHKTSVPDVSLERVALDEQLEVLDSLGLCVPEETAESVRTFMEEHELYDMVEGSPYTWLLMELGYPSYDEDWNLTGYSQDVFWFDYEGLDISTDYIEILNGMLALAEGSSVDHISNIQENIEKVDWEQGDGTITVGFDWNSQTYLYDMEVYYDWIDGRVLGILNPLLQQESSQEYFYVTGDNGQGVIIFFCTPDWAQQFSNETGLTLELCTTQADDIQKGSD